MTYSTTPRDDLIDLQKMLWCLSFDSMTMSDEDRFANELFVIDDCGDCFCGRDACSVAAVAN